MFKENIEAIVSHLENLISSKTVMGNPIVSGNTTIIPVINASCGFGGGSCEEKSKCACGGGGGGGVKLNTSALVVIQGDDVKIYSLTQKGTLSSLAEMIPETLSKICCSHKKQENAE